MFNKIVVLAVLAISAASASFAEEQTVGKAPKLAGVAIPNAQAAAEAKIENKNEADEIANDPNYLNKKYNKIVIIPGNEPDKTDQVIKGLKTTPDPDPNARKINDPPKPKNKQAEPPTFFWNKHKNRDGKKYKNLA